MFTGIIQEIGTLTALHKKAATTTLSIQAPTSAQGALVSDSVAINGVCLTVTRKEKNVLLFDAVTPTLVKTNLAALRIGDLVNIESALKVGDKFGGHFVLGHVDTKVQIARIINKRNYWQITLALPTQGCSRVVENGSIAVEGISLTVKKISGREVGLDIIPFTYLHTTMQHKKPGDWLNIEFDYLLKHTDRHR